MIRLCVKPEDMEMGLKSCVCVYLLEFSESSFNTNGEPSSGVNGSGGRGSLQNGTERESGCERSKRHTKIDASLEWLLERIQT